MTAPHEPDEMGAWDDGGQVAWLPRSRYPLRPRAMRFYGGLMGVRWIDVRCVARHMRHAPELPEAAEFGGEYWTECAPDEPGAFPVWRCEPR